MVDDCPELVSAGRLASETGLPVLWLEEEAKAGRLPCLRIECAYGDTRFLFNRAAVLRRLAARAAAEAGEAAT